MAVLMVTEATAVTVTAEAVAMGAAEVTEAVGAMEEAVATEAVEVMAEVEVTEEAAAMAGMGTAHKVSHNVTALIVV